MRDLAAPAPVGSSNLGMPSKATRSALSTRMYEGSDGGAFVNSAPAFWYSGSECTRSFDVANDSSDLCGIRTYIVGLSGPMATLKTPTGEIPARFIAGIAA